MQEPTYDTGQQIPNGCGRIHQISNVVIDDDRGTDEHPVRYFGREVKGSKVNPIEVSLWWLDETVRA